MVNLIKQSRILADRSFDAKDPPSFFAKRGRNGKTTSLMWILRASTQSSQLDVYPDHSKSGSGSLRHRQVADILSEELDEGVEVAFGQQQIP